MSIIILVHEAGHLFVAKFFGAKVEEFGFGYAPRLCGLVKSHGKWKFFWRNNEPMECESTIYSINFIPFGGFNKLKGEIAVENNDLDNFARKVWWQKFLVVFGGPLMNIVLTFVLLTMVFSVGSIGVIDTNNPPQSAYVSDVSLRVATIKKDSPAARAGLKDGDTIKTIDGAEANTIDAILNGFKGKSGVPVSLVVQRGDTTETRAVVPTPAKELYSKEELVSGELNGEEAVVGLSLMTVGKIKYPFFLAIKEGFVQTGILGYRIIQGIVTLFGQLFTTGKFVGEAMGIVGLTDISAQATHLGFVYFLQFMALISMAIAIFQFIPFPAIDGGHMFFFLIEGLRGGKALNPKIIETATRVGFVILLGLMVIVTYRDIARIISN
ncbi:MAG: site-2 protease family protein [Parcubacteria group bacterium]|nr:site-2 protease family protein [Parcubacteria group bacterium]